MAEPRTSERVLEAVACEQAGYGWACLNRLTIGELGLKPGDTLWLNHGGSPAPFAIDSNEAVERAQVGLNLREMVAMGVGNGTPVAASGTPLEKQFSTEEALAQRRPVVVGQNVGTDSGEQPH